MGRRPLAAPSVSSRLATVALFWQPKNAAQHLRKHLLLAVCSPLVQGLLTRVPGAAKGFSVGQSCNGCASHHWRIAFAMGQPKRVPAAANTFTTGRSCNGCSLRVAKGAAHHWRKHVLWAVCASFVWGPPNGDPASANGFAVLGRSGNGCAVGAAKNVAWPWLTACGFFVVGMFF